MTATALREPQSAGAAYWGRPRCLHVIDLEALIGVSPSPTPAGRAGEPPGQSLRLAWAWYRQAIGIQCGDHAVLGLRSALFGDLSDLLATCGAQLRAGGRPDSVRTALLEAVDVEHAARRYDCVVIAGGHEQFAGLAGAARAAGLRVWLVGGAAPFAPSLAAMPAQQSRLRPARVAA